MYVYPCIYNSYLSFFIAGIHKKGVKEKLTLSNGLYIKKNKFVCVLRGFSFNNFCSMYIFVVMLNIHVLIIMINNCS